MRVLYVLSLLLALLSISAAAGGTQTQGALQIGGRPRVVIVPILNTSGEKWAALKDKQIAKANEYLTDEFTRHGYDIVPTPEVEAAIEALKIDFTDEEQQKRATLYELGRKLNADFILFGMITHTEQKEFNRVLYKDIEGRTDAKVWFLDVRNERALLSAKTFTGRSGGNRITLKPSDRQIQAAANAFRDALQEFFAPGRGSAGVGPVAG